MNKPLILIVEDDPPIRNLISVTLEAHGYRHTVAGNAAAAVLEAASHNPDIMLLDLGLPDMDGVEVIRKVRSWSNMPVIVISAANKPFTTGVLPQILPRTRKYAQKKTGSPISVSTISSPQWGAVKKGK